MLGIDLKKPIEYVYSTFRYFEENEKHVTRICKHDVLVLVFEGVLKFSEEGVLHEVCAGEYYIQRRNSYQTAKVASDSPKYLYVHFFAEWGDGIGILPRSGSFDVKTLMPLMQKLDRSTHEPNTYVEQTADFYSLLVALYHRDGTMTLAEKVATYIEKNYKYDISLETLSKIFFVSKNHIIGVFKKSYGCTPFEYVNSLRLALAERLLVVTTDSAVEIAAVCGFSDYTGFFKVFKRKHGASPTVWRRSK